MTNEIAIADDMKAVERWENEGGQVSLISLWASLKSFTTEDHFRESQVIGAQKSPQHQARSFQGSTWGGLLSET